MGMLWPCYDDTSNLQNDEAWEPSRAISTSATTKPKNRDGDDVHYKPDEGASYKFEKSYKVRLAC